jgi:GntR family transcriptional regulator
MSGNIQGHLERRNKSRQIADYYLKLMDMGYIAPGDRLPGRGEIGRQWEVGAMIAQRALEMLRDTGRVRTERGHGSYVTSADGSTALTLLRFAPIPGQPGKRKPGRDVVSFSAPPRPGRGLQAGP